MALFSLSQPFWGDRLHSRCQPLLINTLPHIVQLFALQSLFAAVIIAVSESDALKQQRPQDQDSSCYYTAPRRQSDGLIIGLSISP